MVKNILTIIFVFLASTFAIGQNSNWSLQRCISYAQDKNLTIQQSNLAVKQSQLALDFSKRDYYPSFNGSVSYGFNVGRSIDPTTNDFVNNAVADFFQKLVRQVRQASSHKVGQYSHQVSLAETLSEKALSVHAQQLRGDKFLLIPH